MRVLNVAHGADTGGWGTRLKQAFGKYAPEVDYQTVAAREKYFAYGTPLYRLRDHASRSELRAMWHHADVVHLRNGIGLTEESLLHPPKRPLVVQHHGSIFRKGHKDILPREVAVGARSLVSTLDLWLLYPGALQWVPSPYDLDWLRTFRQTREPDGVMRIAHAPTNRAVKSTDVFLRAVEKLKKQLPVEVILIERQPWLKCLALKGAADVYYDQCGLGYGNNAVEAMGMGIPVVCGAQDATLAEYERRFGSLPFVLTDEGSIYQSLLYLAGQPNRERWSAQGLEHVRAWHGEETVVSQLHGIYQEVAQQAAVA